MRIDGDRVLHRSPDGDIRVAVDYRILGPLEVLADRRPLDLGAHKQRALLAVLLLDANHVVSTDRLTDALWGETPPRTAGKALQVYVSELRKQLGRERVQTKAPGYLLRVEEGELDLERFERLHAEGRHADALSLWRGPPLAEFAFERFAQPEIARLEELRLVCLEDRIDEDLASGRHSGLVGELESLVNEHPLRARLRVQLMLALYRSGRQAEALDVYQDGRRILVDELGIEPSGELRELQQAILNQDPALDLPAAGKLDEGTLSGIKTFVIADVRGFAAFARSRGDEAAAQLAATFSGLARAKIADRGGSVVEVRGAEALAVFDSARQAIRAAVDLQLAFVDETIANPFAPLAVGIGIDAGEAMRVNGGLQGGALDSAARLSGLAGPAEILASREVAHLAGKVDGIRYVDRGPIRLEGLVDTVDVMNVRPESEDPAQDVAFRRALGPVAVQVGVGLEARNPYKGLRAFEEADAADFFGREVLTAHLVDRLHTGRFLAVVGPSGSGKSSVVRAGLVPALRRGALPGSERWRIVEMAPGGYPVEELEAALLRVAESPPASLLEHLEAGEHGLLRALKRILPPDDSELVLVLDQLEELFTLVEEDERRAHFLRIVERAVVDPHSRLRVVTTLRADFYDRPLLYSGFAELMRDYVEAVVPLLPSEFEQAISGPGARVGAALEPGLLPELIADVADEPGALPLLQYALTELYERRVGNILTRDAYRSIGGVPGALAGRADQTFDGLSPPARDAARQLFLRLVTLGEGTEDTRRRVDRGELASIEVDQSAMAEAVDAFGGSRLLSFDRDLRTGKPTIEVAHEALLREWVRLRRWIDSAREDVRMHRRLLAAASEWAANERDESFLLRGGHLGQFESWSEESSVALTGLEREFVDASGAEGRREQLRQRRENRRLKALLAGVGVLLALAVAAGVVALLQRRSADHQATIALARGLGSEAVIEPRLDRAMLLAREAVQLNRSSATEGTLLSALLRSPAAIATFSYPIQAQPVSVALSPDGRTLDVSDNQAFVRFFDTRSHRESRAPIGQIAYGFPALYSEDGTLLAALSPASKPPGIALLDARTLEVVRVLPFDARVGGASNSAASNPFGIAPDDKTAFYAYTIPRPDQSDGPAYLDYWDVASRKLTTIPLGSDGLLGAAFVAAGTRIVTVTDTQIATWDARTLRRLDAASQPVRQQAGVAGISPDGRTVAIGTSFGSVSFVDVASGQLTPGTAAHSAAVQQFAFSPDGRVLASMGADARVIVWNPSKGQSIETLTGHGGPVTGAAFSRDGRTLFTVSTDGAIFEWDLGVDRRFGQPLTTMAKPPRLGFDAQQVPPPLAVSPDGSAFAARAGASTVGIYSTSTLQRLQTFSVEAGGDVIGLAWSAGGELAVTGNSGHVQLWDVKRAPRLTRVLRGLRSVNKQPEAVTTVAFSPDGRFVAAGDINHVPGYGRFRLGTVAVWDASGRRLWMATNHVGWITTVVFSPDGASLAAVREDGTVMLYDARTGRLERRLHTEGATGLTFETAAFAPDARTLATGSWSGIVQLWDTATGDQIGRPTLVAASPVASIAFAPAGDTFATAGSSDGLAKLWTAKTRQQFGATFPGNAGQWGSVRYTPDGSKLIVVYQDGKGFVWPVSARGWADHACAVAGRNLTREEWSRFVGGRRYRDVCAGLP
jgi:WD40 repeat protein/DNA-binding SARP family transcriptional activator